MTGPQFGHAEFGELAAGYALDALEPADEQRFLRHAADCPRCRALVADFRQVTEALAETAPPAEPSSDFDDRVLAATRPRPASADGRIGAAPESASATRDSAGTELDSAGSAPDSAGAGQESAVPDSAGRGRVVPLRRRGQRWRRPAAVAAAAAIIAGGVWGGLAATAPGPQPVLAACARPHACTQITLTATATGRTAATVIVHDGVAYMQPAAAMGANPADEIYVLWQITGARIPLAVGSFDVHPGARGPVRIGDLAVSYTGTWAFAVSLEHGRTIPAHPSKPVALGQVS
jgi:anti-sigma-K factor RskA